MSGVPKFYLEKRKDKEGNPIVKNCLIRMYITIPLGRVEYSTGIKVDARHFLTDYLAKGKEPIKVSAPNFDEHNRHLNSLYLEALNIRNLINANNEDISVKTFKERLDLKHKPKRENEYSDIITFIDYLELLISQRGKGKKLQPNGKLYSPANVRKLKTLLSSLQRYIKYSRKRDLKFEDINDAFYDSYKKFNFDIEKKRVSTFGGLIKDVKTVINEAISDGFVTGVEFTKKNFISPQYESDSVALNIEQLDLINSVELSDPELLKTRDIFLIGCYTALRYSDLKNLSISKIDENFIRVKQQKTDAYVSIPVIQKLNDILKKYNGTFPDLDVNLNTYNDRIRKIAELAKLIEITTINDTKGGKKKKVSKPLFELISSHTARRTYATMMFKLGIPTSLIMAVTGHITEKSFLKYVKATNEDKARMMADLMKKLNM